MRAKPTPDDEGAAQSVGTPQTKGTVRQIVDLPQDISYGAVKGIVDVPREFAQLGSNLGEAFSHTKLGQSIGNFIREQFGGVLPPEAAQQISEGLKMGVEQTEATKPQTVGENIGYTAEKIAEFFVPGIAAEAVAGKLVGKAPQLAEMASALSSTRAGKLLLDAVKLGGESVSAGSIAAAQSDDLKEGVNVAALNTILSPALSVTLNRVFPSISKYLQETSLRLTPTQRTNLGSKLDSAIQWLSRNKVVGSAANRYEKVTGVYEAMENTLQSSLKSSGVSVPIEPLVKEIDNLKALYRSDRDAEAIYRQLDSAIDTLKKMNPSGHISAEDLNTFKRTTMSGAFNKAGDKVSDAVEYDLGDVVYKNLADALESAGVKISGKTLQAFNQEYSAVLNARKLLKIAAGRKQAGFLAKLLSGIAGASLGSAFGGPLGAAAGTVVAPALSEAIAGGAARTGTATVLDQLSKLSALDLLKILYGSLPKD